MIAFVLLSLPIFGVVALGWTAMRTRLASPGVLEALGAFSFGFALPALVLRLIAGQPLDRSFNPVFYGGYLASGGLIFTFVFGLSRILERQAVAAAGARATTTTVSNLGFLGPPLVLAFFGERGAGPLAMAILAEVMVLLSLGGVIMGVSSGGAGVGSLVLRGTVLNPVVAAIVLGATLAATGVPLPMPLDRFLGFLGGSAGPTAFSRSVAHWPYSASIARLPSPQPGSPRRSSWSILYSSGTCWRACCRSSPSGSRQVS